MPRPNTSHAKIPHHVPTPAQLNLLAELFIDCEFSSSLSRKSFLIARFNKQYSDDLTKDQISKAIDELLQQRARARSSV